MDFYSIASFITTLAIMVAFLNHLYIRMQTTTAVMVASLLISTVLIILAKYNLYSFEQTILLTLEKIDFHHLLIDGMLSFLLFAGSLTIDIHSLKTYKWEISVLASITTILSTFLVAIITYYLLPLLNINLSFIYCLLFGALISPTDPIAVLANFKKLQAPKSLDTLVAGESLFNDGVGIVIFLTLYQLAFSNATVTTTSVLLLFLQQAAGGILYGLILGIIGGWLMGRASDPKIEILLTLALTTGGYTLAKLLNVSGPLAMVMAGIYISGYARHQSMTESGKQLLNEFWELIDEILNCILFLLIGFELMVVVKNNHYLVGGLYAIPLMLVVRTITVIIPMSFFKRVRDNRYYNAILVWGGLRGGLAVALALALPPGEYRQIILAMTYAVVAFAVVVQGITIAPLVRLAKHNKI